MLAKAGLGVCVAWTLCACPSTTKPTPKGTDVATAPDAEPIEAEAPPSVAKDVVAVAGEPLKLPITGPNSPWLENRLAFSLRTATRNSKTAASGTLAAVVKTDGDQYVAFHDSVGAVGVLKVPAKTKWLGFGKNDQLLAADAAGAIHIALSLTKWEKQGGAPGATIFDVAPGVLAASDGKSVWVSADDGKTFGKPFKPGKTIKQVFVRAPNTVVVASVGKKASVWISANGGNSFRKSSLRPSGLSKIGPWIRNQDWDCPAVLSSDNRTWVEPTTAQLNTSINTYGWFGPLQTSSVPDYYPMKPDWATPSHPAVPTVKNAARKIRGASACAKNAGGGVEGGVAGGMLGLLPWFSGQCKGAGCLRSAPAAEPPATSTGFFFLRDGKCKSPGMRPSCTPDKVEREPHVATVNQTSGEIQIAKLPEGCQPLRMYSSRGIGLLFCERAGGTATDVWTATRGTEWTRETTIDVGSEKLWNLSSASDGTLLIQHSCPWKASECSVSVRRPRAPGTSDAWFTVTEEGALTHRPVVGGRVLTALLAEGGLIISLAAAPEQREAITTLIRSDIDLHGLKLQDDGRIRLIGKVGGGPWAAHVTSDGKLLKTAPVPPKKNADGVIITTPRPIDPAHTPFN